MSVLTFEITTPSITSRLPELLRNLWATNTAQVRNYNDLKALPDRLLLDIGVDPRNVPCNVEGLSDFRTTAKS